ncbi:unnamed protein product [Penicillium nalgiovense]|uniref:Uncharacterized protein n=1 Tax=Penicillium nalgiovense TaxID=60175 RepID=A0A9W4HCE6_PENNA|nr:unnamed protein product [Penicillium nalgiovense]CAG7979424.1 unnamed protein product [Penicillium nalgiovense]CAG7981994.1 unnamed protein product [Penicillium nalgiovense]CAG7989927.1 unnamed protein product [Penicillium nalgiovense]CAG7991550.1 unnamed protein product [Penicillium nalgiovense]
MQINSPSILSLAFILALTPPTISHPIQTSKWVKIEQFQDPNDRGIWKVFEKEGYHDQLPDPPHVKYHGNPSWPNQNNELEQEIPNDRYKTGTSESGKPTVSILIPASTEIPEQMHKPYTQQTGEKQEYHSEDKESSIDTLDAQRKGHYEILQYPHTEGAINNGHQYTPPAFFSHASSSSGWASFFAYRYPFPTMRSEAVAFPQYPLPRVYMTVIVLLLMVWVAIFTIGLLELGNYLWKRRAEALGREDVQGLHSEEGDASFDETMKVPLAIVIAPSENTRSRSVGEYGNGFLESVSSDYESDSGSGSDEDDYRIF